MAETTETIRIQSNIRATALDDAKALDRVVAAVAAVNKAELAGDTGANRIKAAHEAVTAELNKQVQLEAKILSFDSARTRKVAELESQYAKLQKSATAGAGGPQGGGGGLGGLLGSDAAGLAIGGAAIAALTTAAAIAAKIVEATFGITVATAKFAIAASDFKGEAVGGFARVLGNDSLGAELYAKVLDAAVATGLSKERAIGEARKLLASGYKADEIPKLVKLFADLEKVKGEGQSEPIQKLLQKINAADKFDAKSVTALAKQGIATADVYTALEKKLGKTHDQVQALLKTGGIKGDTGIDVVAGILEKKFGGAAAADSFGDLFSGLKIRFEQLFEDVDTSPMKDALKSVLEVLGGPGGKELKGELTNTIGSLFHALFDPFKGPEGVKKLEGILHTVSAALRLVRGAIEAVGPYFGKLTNWLAEAGGSGSIDQGIDKIMKVIEVVHAIEQALVEFNPKPLADLIAEWLGGDAAPDLSSVGSDMIDGLIGGIEGGAAGVVDALVGAVTSAVDAAKAALGISSPSKVFEALGGHTSAGFAQGITGGAPDVHAAAGGMAQGAAYAAEAAYAPPGGAGGAGGGTSIGGAGPSAYHFNITMPAGASGGQQVADEAFRAFEKKVRRFRRDEQEATARAA